MAHGIRTLRHSHCPNFLLHTPRPPRSSAGAGTSRTRVRHAPSLSPRDVARFAPREAQPMRDCSLTTVAAMSVDPAAPRLRRNRTPNNGVNARAHCWIAQCHKRGSSTNAALAERRKSHAFQTKQSTNADTPTLRHTSHDASRDTLAGHQTTHDNLEDTRQRHVLDTFYSNPEMPP